MTISDIATKFVALAAATAYGTMSGEMRCHGYDSNCSSLLLARASTDRSTLWERPLQTVALCPPARGRTLSRRVMVARQPFSLVANRENTSPCT